MISTHPAPVKVEYEPVEEKKASLLQDVLAREASVAAREETHAKAAAEEKAKKKAKK